MVWTTVGGDVENTATRGTASGGTGREVWRNRLTALGERRNPGPPRTHGAWNLALGHDRLLVVAYAGHDRFVVCLDPETGEEQWTWGRVLSDWRRLLPPVVGTDHVVVARKDGHEGVLAGLDPGTGEPAWERAIAEDAPQKLALADGRILLACRDRVLAHREATGQRLWEEPLSSDELPDVLLPTREGVVVVAHDELGLLDLETGETLWTRAVPDSGLFTGVAVAGGTLLVEQEKLRAFDLTDGSQRWDRGPGSQRVVGDDGLVCTAGPLVLEDRVLSGFRDGPESTALACLDAGTGSHRWTVSELTEGRLEALCGTGDRIFACGASRAFCLDLARQRQHWKQQIPPVNLATDPRSGILAAGEDLLFVATEQEGVVALDAGRLAA